MTDPHAPEYEGGTELTEEEREGLIPSYITLRSELNEAELANILEAEAWAFGRKRNLLEEKFLSNLHAAPRNPPASSVSSAVIFSTSIALARCG